MRYATILGTAVFASVTVVTAPAYVESQSTGDKVEQKAEQTWQKTKDVTRDAKVGVVHAVDLARPYELRKPFIELVHHETVEADRVVQQPRRSQRQVADLLRRQPTTGPAG